MSENRQSRDDRRITDDLSKMTAEELEEQLAECWDAMDEENFDPRLIDACLAALDERKPQAADYQPQAALDAFREKHRLLFEQAQSVPRSAQCAAHSVRSRPRRAVRLIAAAAAVMLGCMMAAQALGVDVFGAIAHWTEETFRIGVPPQSELVQPSQPLSDEALSYTSLQEALDAYGIAEVAAPGWLPEGFELIEVKVSPTPRLVGFHAAYECGERFLAVSIRQYANAEDASSSIFEKDDTPVTLYEHSGITHYIMSNYDQLTAVWMNGNILYSIHGDLSEEELQRIIDSVYDA